MRRYCLSYKTPDLHADSGHLGVLHVEDAEQFDGEYAVTAGRVVVEFGASHLQILFADHQYLVGLVSRGHLDLLNA